jgi:hypothetical protein
MGEFEDFISLMGCWWALVPRTHPEALGDSRGATCNAQAFCDNGVMRNPWFNSIQRKERKPITSSRPPSYFEPE